MARPGTGANLNITQLEQILEERKRELDKLMRQRSEWEKKLNGLDRQIERLGGTAGGGRRGRGNGGGGSGRARNEQSLMDTIESVLRDRGAAMKVSEIVEAVQGTGYRSNSANFRGIVNQTLIKDKRFVQAGRGVYELKGGGGAAKAKKEKAEA